MGLRPEDFVCSLGEGSYYIMQRIVRHLVNAQ